MTTFAEDLPRKLVIKAPDPDDSICCSGVIFPALGAELLIMIGF